MRGINYDPGYEEGKQAPKPGQKSLSEKETEGHFNERDRDEIELALRGGGRPSTCKIRKKRKEENKKLKRS